MRTDVTREVVPRTLGPRKINTALERDGQGKKNTRKMGTKTTENRTNSARVQGLTFVNPDATRDGEDPVWRLLGPGSDRLELIRPRCALRRGAASGLETRASIDVALQARRISIELRIN